MPNDRKPETAFYLDQPEHSLHFYGSFGGAAEFIEMIDAAGGCVTSIHDDDQRGWMTLIFRASEFSAKRVEAICFPLYGENVTVGSAPPEHDAFCPHCGCIVRSWRVMPTTPAVEGKAV